jgi:hypothetical protein
MKTCKFIIITIIVYFASQTLVSAQIKTDKQYGHELKKFMQFVRDSVLIYRDTVYIRPYLYNKDMFLGVVLFGRNGLTKQEKEDLVVGMRTDTSKYFLSQNFLKKFNFIPTQNEDYGWKISKPVFLRSYLLCAFSFGSDGSQKTYLYKKENGKWGVLELIGRVDNY